MRLQQPGPQVPNCPSSSRAQLLLTEERGQTFSLPPGWLAEQPQLPPAAWLMERLILSPSRQHLHPPTPGMDYAGCPYGTWSTKSAAETGQLAKLPAASRPSALRRKEDFRVLLERHFVPLLFCRFRMNKLLLFRGGQKRTGH